MVADDRTHIVDVDGLHAQTAADLTGNKFSVLQTVTVADEHRLTGGVDGGGLHPVYQSGQRRLAASGLADRDQAALVDPTSDFANVEARLFVESAMEMLTPLEREIFSSCLLGGMPIRQFAERRGLRKSTAWDMANAIRKKLREIF